MSTYFISPYGEIIVDTVKHIDIIIKNPEKFGLTLDEIKEFYIKYNERIGTEGKAREEIILNLINQGWIRARYYKNKHWSININRLNNKVKDYLFDFAKAIIKEKLDKYADVHILSPLECIYSTISDIADNGLYN